MNRENNHYRKPKGGRREMEFIYKLCKVDCATGATWKLAWEDLPYLLLFVGGILFLIFAPPLMMWLFAQ